MAEAENGEGRGRDAGKPGAERARGTSSGDDDQPGSSLVQAQEKPPERLLILDQGRMTLFPGMMLPLVLIDEHERHVVEQAWNQTRFLGLVARRTDPPQGERPTPGQLHDVGVTIRLHRFAKSVDGRVHAIVQCLARMRIVRYQRTAPVLFAEVAYPPETFGDPTRTEALLARTQDTLRELLKLMPGVPEEFGDAALSIEDAARLADFVAANFEMKGSERQEILALFDVTDRLERVLVFLTGELEVRRLGKRIQEEIQEKIQKSQREYFLREQLKVIRRELGEEVDEKEAVQDDYEQRIAKAGMSDEAEKRAREELSRLSVLTPQSAEHHVIKTYLDWLTELPWSNRTQDNLDIDHAQRILDEDHYGLKDVKERIIEYIAVRKLKPDQRGAILCLAGPPGVGKTSLGRSLARALGREFFRFSLGGMRDEAEIKGHRRTYVGAMPGKILQGLRRVGTKNPLFMLDEIDKVGSDWRGDPSSALLEALDPEQNNDFLDHYLDVRFDLSEVMFLCTGNVKSSIPAPLLDRMEVIDISSYIDDEKYHIASRHLFPRQRERHGLGSNHLRISRAALFEIIDGYTREAGVRNLERQISKICRKTAARVARDAAERVSVTKSNVSRFLGPRQRLGEEIKRAGERPGISVGLAWTPVGGEVMLIETARTPGKGRLQLTGQLGEVMSESARIALTYVRSEAGRFGIDPEVFGQFDLHAHFPAGAIPKDGPSAGTAITTALISLLSGKEGRKVKGRLAMTGEITLTGKVLPVGGIREKVIAARKAGIREVILPAPNERDLDEIPEKIRKGVSFHFAESYADVFRVAFP